MVIVGGESDRRLVSWPALTVGDGRRISAANSWAKDSSCRTDIRSGGKSAAGTGDELEGSERKYLRGLASTTVSADRRFRCLEKEENYN